MEAYNTNNKKLRSGETVQIQVTLNPNSPTFEQAYSISVPEVFGQGGSVLQVNATDDDGVSMKYLV